MNTTTTTRLRDYDDQFRLCWRRQDCGGCLDQDGCGWCPFTQACVPNNYIIPLLAPAYDENICPHWTERWEIRTRPFGCQVSTITSLTAIVSIVLTLVVALLIFGAVLLIKKLKKIRRENPNRWATWKRSWRGPRWVIPSRRIRTDSRRGNARNLGEERPLLGT